MLIFQGVYQPEITLKQKRAMQDQRLYQAIGSSVFGGMTSPIGSMYGI